MIIVRFHGGLGNQMFEYAFYRYMTNKYGADNVIGDMTWFDRNYSEHQGYELKKVFDIDIPAIDYKTLAKIHEYYPRYHRFAGFRYLSRKYAKYKNKHLKPTGEYIMDFGPSQYIHNDAFDKLDTNKDYYIEGVFCSDAYIKYYENQIKKELTFKPNYSQHTKDMLPKIEETNSVAIHVRRGDYVGNVFDIVTPDYYRQAVNYIRERVENPVFFVFSDDMDYIKANFDFLGDCVPVHNCGKDSFQDMYLISRCRHMIIANSSFSYFGALLGEKDNTIVIAPKKYKADEDLALARENWVLL